MSASLSLSIQLMRSTVQQRSTLHEQQDQDVILILAGIHAAAKFIAGISVLAHAAMDVLFASQNAAHASISLWRFSN